MTASAIRAEPGRIITFYSYKGGTGRSMALANLAYLLSDPARSSGRALAIDWDLEAPGLHRYLAPLLPAEAEPSAPGLIELFAELAQRTPHELPEALDAQEALAEQVIAELDLAAYAHETAREGGGLHFMPAGRFDPTYAARVTGLDWAELYGRLPALIGAFARRLASEYSYVLIDSRTGISDTSGICTMLMPELLVAVFTPNRQSLEGLLDIARRAAEFRLQSTDVRPLTVFPLPSRIEPTRPALVAQWRHGELDGVRGYQPQFEELLGRVYGLEQCDLTAYFDEIQIQHVPDYAYGERLAAHVEGTSDRLSLRRSYENFARWLVSGAAPWLAPETVEAAGRIASRCAAATISVAEGKLDDARKLLTQALEEPPAARAQRSAEIAEAFGALGRAMQEASQLADAEDAYRQAVTIAVEAGGLGDLTIAEYQERRAEALNALGQPAQAVEALRNVTARREAALGRTHESVAEAYEKLGTALVAQGRPWEGTESLEEGLAIRQAALGRDHPSVAAALERLAEAMVLIGDLPSSERYLQQALDLIPADRPGDRARVLNSLGALHLRARSLTVAERQYAQARELLVSAEAKYAVVSVEASAGLGRVCTELAQFDRAQDHLEQAQALGEEVLGPQHPATLHIVLDFGDLARARDDLVRAGRQYQRIATRFEKNPSVQLAAEAFTRLGEVALARAEYAEARGWFERALSAFANLRNPAGQGDAYASLGTLALMEADYTAARRQYNLAVAAHEAISNQAGMVETYVLLGNLCRASGGDDEATIWYRRALDTSKKLGRDSAVASAWFERAQLSLQREEYGRARRRFRRSLAIADQLGDPQRRVLSLTGMGSALRGLRELGQAREIEERLLSEVESVYGPRHPTTQRARLELARTLREQGELRDAQALQEHAVAVLGDVLGEQHPETRRAAEDLAHTVRAHGEGKARSKPERPVAEAPKRPPPRRDAVRRTRVAVLGGGVGAMAAAFELTAPELAGRYDVTVYQPGWRLGGKCASGRAGPHARIEEHGLHVWFGFYANAFNLMQRCYAEWAPPRTSPLRTWQDAFKQCNDIVLFERWKGEWKPWHLYLAPDDEIPGTRDDVPPWEFLRRVLEFLLDQWGLVREQHGAAMPEEAKKSGRGLHLPVIDRLVQMFGNRVEELNREAGSHLLELAFKIAQACSLDPSGYGNGHEHTGHVAELLQAFKRWVFDEVLEPMIDTDLVRRYAILLDFWATTVTGMVADSVFDRGFGQINDIDLLKWLKHHGAETLTLEHAAFLKGLYDLVFAYREGDKRRPDLAAGKALQAAIRIVLEYKGAVLWKMQAGMGDTVLTPLYDVLRRRGVRFRFFHQVTKLCVSDDGQSLASVEVQPQARIKRGSYDPIVTVGHLRCWPSEPKWHELVGGDELRARGVNFEQAVNPLGLKAVVLKAGEDFDEVVLGIPVGALPPLCEELAAANERFRAMLEHSDTVMTEGIQLWLTRTAAELGWPFEPAIATSYVTRADTYSNMSQLLPRETWSSGGAPADVAYLCGVLKHEGIETQADADARVRENALGFVEHDARALWPNGGHGGRGLGWEELAADDGMRGPDRLDAQFLRANFQPTERYVLTRAGSVAYRLRADESGFANLKLAGDWTRNGIDGGSVEAAITSGMQAARAISGHPRLIQGEHGWLVDD